MPHNVAHQKDHAGKAEHDGQTLHMGAHCGNIPCRWEASPTKHALHRSKEGRSMRGLSKAEPARLRKARGSPLIFVSPPKAEIPVSAVQVAKFREMPLTTTLGGGTPSSAAPPTGGRHRKSGRPNASKMQPMQDMQNTMVASCEIAPLLKVDGASAQALHALDIATRLIGCRKKTPKAKG